MSRHPAQAIDAIRRGWPVRICAGGIGVDLLAIETADAQRLAAFEPETPARILISAGRAETLRLTNQIEAAEPDRAVLVDRAPWIDLDVATAMADPVLDLATPLKGPFRAVALEQEAIAAAAMRLARHAGMLPAFFWGDTGADVAVAVTVTVDEIAGYADAGDLFIAARARLPVEASTECEIIAFRGASDASEHVALVIGQPDGSLPVVRLHSECLTGDVFGSLKCDCGPQLHAALHEMATASWGILLYLRQEGRGIGLINKLRAYALQDQGFDTVDANVRLGLAVDARDFGIAARMLALLGQSEVRLLTNNPNKVAVLEAMGVTVAERVPHQLPSNPFNAAYLATKKDRTGHMLD
nr:GTP cyclohydrolase II [Aquisediminimonas sediminicola]